jgi:hypothetical protein
MFRTRTGILLTFWTVLLIGWTVFIVRPSLSWLSRSRRSEAELNRLRDSRLFARTFSPASPILKQLDAPPENILRSSSRISAMVNQSLAITEFIQSNPPQEQLTAASNLLASTRRQLEVAAAPRSNLGFVLDGQPALPGQVPYQVAVVYSFDVPEAKNGYHCGGVLIERSWVLTAGHCFQEDTQPIDFQVYMGSLKLSMSAKPNACCWSPIKRLVRYPGYQQIAAPSLQGDIFTGDAALLELDNPPLLSSDIGKIDVVDNLIERDVLQSGMIAQISGWGVTRQGGSSSDALMVGKVKLMTDTACAAGYSNGIIDNKFMKCSPPGDVQACRGDSGGPLVMKTKAHVPYVEAIVSWGYPDGGCPSTKPNVYSRISAFSDWITQCVAGKDCPSELKSQPDISGVTRSSRP